MMRYLAVLLAVITVFSLSAADFRIDLSGINGTTMKPAAASEGVSLGQASWRGKKKDQHLSCTVKVTKEWKKYSFSFIAKKSGKVSLNLMSSTPKDFFACDNITASGFELRNGDFEQLNDKGEPSGWYKMKNPRFSSSDGVDGSNCAITAHNDRWHQIIVCKKGELATITFYARSIK